MSQGLAYVNGKWERVSGSDLQLGSGFNQAARGDHGHPLGGSYRDIVQTTLTGGGEIAHRNGAVKWSQRFISMGSGRGAALNITGWLGFYCPTAGEVIQGAFGKANVTATADGVPMSGWDQLYAILPKGGGSGTVPTANYRLVNYNSQSEMLIPEDWVWIIGFNGDVGNNLIKLCTGASFALNYQHRPDTGWVSAPLVNGWVHYGAPWEQAAYRRLNDVCYIRGLIRNGTATAGTTIFTLPAGFRPVSDSHVAAVSNGQWAILNVFADGRVNCNTNTASGWVSLANISHPCEN